MLNILLTGAAGLIGGEVAARLVSAGHHVHALVHSRADIRGNDGTDVSVAAVYAGNICAPQLGLGDDDFRQLAKQCDLLIHCAATTRFDLSPADYDRINVGGTRHAVDLARAGDMALLHVSTAYVCGPRDGLVRERDALPKDGFSNGYEASKAAAEQIVSQSGLRHAIARPSIVVGAHGSGQIREFNTLYALFRAMATGQLRQIPARGGASFDFVPIDHVAAGILALAERMGEANGAVFHLVSGQPVEVAGFVRLIGRYAQFDEPEIVAADSFAPEALPAMERRIFARMAGQYAGYFLRNPRFDDSAFQALTGLSCPPCDEAYLRALINYAIGEGYLPAAPVSAHADNAAQVAL